MKQYFLPSLIAILSITAFIGCDKNKNPAEWMIPETDDSLTSAEITGYVYRPAVEDATDENISQLKVPSGYSVTKFASELGKPRIIVVSPAGHVYVSDREAGVVLLLKDTNADGKADTKQTIANLPQAHGLAIHSNRLYIITVTQVFVADINPDGTISSPTMIIDNLPDGGQHPNRTLAIGPDNLLYISIGSTCNACTEPNAMNATVVQANLDGSGLKIYAKGLRNTIGFGWHPTTKELWGADHGIDWLGDDEQEEELNQIQPNAHFGWPYIYGKGKYNPGDRPPGDTTYQQFLALSKIPAFTFQAHSAPMQMLFYSGTMLTEFTGDAFIALHGSWNRSKPVGYSVVRIHFENGRPATLENFLTGFLINNNKALFGRPVGVAMHADGSLLISDDVNGVMYRIAKAG